MNRSTKTIALTLVALAAATTNAQGIFMSNGKHYIVHRDNIPDFDQRKMADAANGINGLPNNGNMYCVPTATLNNLTYLANHGYPLLGAGSGDWSGSAPIFLSQYNHVTAYQHLLGVLFHTDADDGTGGIKDYLQDHLNSVYPGQFAVTELYPTGSFAPSVYDGAQAMLNGSLVNLAYGSYIKDYGWNSATHGYDPYYFRVGGHIVTMVGATDWNGTINVSLHDPANPNDGNTTTQSAFTDDITNYQDFYARWGATLDIIKEDDKFFRTLQKLDYSGGYLDNILKITPKFGYTFQNEDIIFMTPNSPTDGRGRPERPPFTVIKTGIGRKIANLAMDPYSELVTFVAEDTNALFTFDPVSKSVSRSIEVSKPRQVVYDEDGSLILLRDNQLDIYDRLLHRQRNIGLQQRLDTIAYDQASHRVVGYSRSANVLVLFDKLLNRQGTIALPTTMPSLDLAQMFIGDDGQVTILGKGSRVIVRVSFGRNGEPQVSQIPIPLEVSNPDGGYVDEDGRAFLAVDGSVMPLTADGHLDRTSKFFGMPVGRSLQILRPFANKKVNVKTTPGYINILPPYYGGR